MAQPVYYRLPNGEWAIMPQPGEPGVFQSGPQPHDNVLNHGQHHVPRFDGDWQPGHHILQPGQAFYSAHPVMGGVGIAFPGLALEQKSDDKTEAYRPSQYYPPYPIAYPVHGAPATPVVYPIQGMPINNGISVVGGMAPMGGMGGIYGSGGLNGFPPGQYPPGIGGNNALIPGNSQYFGRTKQEFEYDNLVAARASGANAHHKLRPDMPKEDQLFWIVEPDGNPHLMPFAQIDGIRLGEWKQNPNGGQLYFLADP